LKKFVAGRGRTARSNRSVLTYMSIVSTAQAQDVQRSRVFHKLYGLLQQRAAFGQLFVLNLLLRQKARTDEH